MYRLFDELAHRYDLHTPPDHYRHDHAFVLAQAADLGSPCRMLDVGCGTGVLVQKARQAGIVARGIDASPAMIRVAEARVGKDAVAVRRMQELDDEAGYDLVVALSWTINYCDGADELRDVLRRMHRALRPGGRVLLQVAHAANVEDEPMEDHEAGPDGERDDVVLRYRFVQLDGPDLPLRAEYEYTCASLNERVAESHILRLADAPTVAERASEAGFEDVQIYDSWRRDPLHRSPSPFVCATARHVNP